VRDTELRFFTPISGPTRGEIYRNGDLCLDNAFVLIEGHPPCDSGL